MNQRLDDVRKTIHSQYLEWRNVDRVVQGELFKLAWEKDQNKLNDTLNQLSSPEQLRRMIRDILFDNLEDCSVRILIELAKQKGIANYSRLSRGQLLKELYGIKKV